MGTHISGTHGIRDDVLSGSRAVPIKLSATIFACARKEPVRPRSFACSHTTGKTSSTYQEAGA
eukprot:1975879-Prymnesium_polylepis.2